MRIAAVTFVLMSLAATAFAQPAEMKQLDFLLGEWKGEGWIQMGPGGREPFVQTEIVRTKLGGSVITMDGHARNPESGKTVHEAFAVVAWDEQKNVHRMSAFVAPQGKGVDTTLETGDRKAVWTMETPQGMRIRYTIRLNDKGEWHEVGEVLRPGTAEWRQFFEMTLRKVQ
jgi:hypothetical protein